MVDKANLFRQRREGLEDLFSSLSKESGPIIVEGKRDRQALVMGNVEKDKIIMLHGKALFDVEEQVAMMNPIEIILLLDYDETGLELMKHFTSSLQARGLRVNTWYWSKIREIFGGFIDCIENIRRYFK